MRMNIVAIWTSLALLQTSFSLASFQNIYPFVGQKQEEQSDSGYSGKRASGTTTTTTTTTTVAEPTCEELRAMWRYSKRQSRAAESTNELPVYRDPFSYNVWDANPSRSLTTYSDDYVARSRSSGIPIYGKIMHKAPAGGRLRNGLRDRSRAFEDLVQIYGSVNRQPPRLTSNRVGGGGGVPQAGSFQHLKQLIINERARELQEQRNAEEVAERATVLKEMTSGERNPNRLDTVQGSYQEPNGNYDFAQYVADVDPELGKSKTDRYGRKYTVR